MPSAHPTVTSSSNPTSIPSWKPSRNSSSSPSSVSSSPSHAPSALPSNKQSPTPSETVTGSAPIFSFEHDLSSQPTSETDNILSTSPSPLLTFYPSSSPTIRPSFLRIEPPPSVTANPTTSHSPSLSPSSGPTQALYVDGLIPEASSGRRNKSNSNEFYTWVVFLSKHLSCQLHAMEKILSDRAPQDYLQ
mmetsp:Transcript_10259/g.21093  ORF Transcript_10259/g.21093 Transcript_10259/m.21093 type:complete len:190 (-) Transcript_10259:1034-1603(-)